MKKIVITMCILFVLGVNVFLLLPEQSTQPKAEECSVLKFSEIELSEVKPGILPHLLKS